MGAFHGVVRVLSNPGEGEVMLQVQVVSNLGSDGSTRIVVPPRAPAGPTRSRTRGASAVTLPSPTSLRGRGRASPPRPRSSWTGTTISSIAGRSRSRRDRPAEVEGIAALFPPEDREVHLGAGAVEE